jgi:hypothetical protein
MKLLLNGPIDAGIGIAKNERTDRHGVIEVTVIVNIPEVSPLSALGKDRRYAAHVLTRSFGEGLRLCRDESLGSLKKLLGSLDRWICWLTHG